MLKTLAWLALPAIILLVLLRNARPQAPAHPLSSNEINVAAAADMEPVFAVIGPIFEQRTGAHLKISYASSAGLSQQIQQGSPADIFFSADIYFAQQLAAANLTTARLPEPYAHGVLGLYERNDGPFKPLSIDLLSRKDIQSVAVANPDKAPYGRAAIAVLKQMKFWDNVAPHLVQAESVAQAAQFALSGNAQLALISQTLAISPKYKSEGTFVLFPFSQYPAITQTAVILKAGKNQDGAHRLLDFMLTDEIQADMVKLGLRTIK